MKQFLATCVAAVLISAGFAGLVNNVVYGQLVLPGAGGGGGCTTNCTFTGNTTISSGSFGLSGNISAPAWTTNGIRYNNVAATLTDTTSSGTVAAIYNDLWGGNTNAASSATTYTTAYGSFFKNPVAGTNVTFAGVAGGARAAIGADSVAIGGPPAAGNVLTVTGSAYFANNISANGIFAEPTIDNNIIIQSFSTGELDFSPTSGTPRVKLYAAGNANLQLGVADAAAPVAQTFQVQSVVAGTSNTAGADWTFNGSKSTGTGVGGGLIFKTALAGSAGTTQNSPVVGLTIKNGTAILAGYTVSTLPASPTQGATAFVTDAVACTFLATITGGGSAFCPVIWTGSAWQGA